MIDNLSDNQTFDPTTAATSPLLWAALATLERAAAARVPGLRGIAEGIDRASPLAARAATSHARACLVTLIERCGPEEVRQVSIDLDSLVAAASPARSSPAASDSMTPLSSVREWSRIAATAVGRRGSITADRALRTRHGKGAEVLAVVVNAEAMQTTRQEILAALPGPETTWVSHVLTELESAGLIVRWNDGRQTVVSATGLGRDIAEANDLIRASEVASDKARAAPETNTFGHVVELSEYAKFIRDKGQPYVRPAPNGQSAVSQMKIATG
jgi:predicted transcriptional regulator